MRRSSLPEIIDASSDIEPVDAHEETGNQGNEGSSDLESDPNCSNTGSEDDESSSGDGSDSDYTITGSEDESSSDDYSNAHKVSRSKEKRSLENYNNVGLKEGKPFPVPSLAEVARLEQERLKQNAIAEQDRLAEVAARTERTRLEALETKTTTAVRSTSLPPTQKGIKGAFIKRGRVTGGNNEVGIEASESAGKRPKENEHETSSLPTSAAPHRFGREQKTIFDGDLQKRAFYFNEEKEDGLWDPKFASAIYYTVGSYCFNQESWILFTKEQQNHHHNNPHLLMDPNRPGDFYTPRKFQPSSNGQLDKELFLFDIPTAVSNIGNKPSYGTGPATRAMLRDQALGKNEQLADVELRKQMGLANISRLQGLQAKGKLSAENFALLQALMQKYKNVVIDACS